MIHNYSEDALIEQPAIALFKKLGWQTANCFYEFDHGPSTLGRENKGEMVLRKQLLLLTGQIPTPTARSFVKRLRDAGIVKEIRAGSGRRSGIFAFPELINIVEGSTVF